MIVDVHSHLIPREMVPPGAVAAMTLMSDVEGFLQSQAESPVDFISVETSTLSRPSTARTMGNWAVVSPYENVAVSGPSDSLTSTA